MTNAIAPVERAKLDELLEIGGDAAFVREVVDSYVSDASARIDSLFAAATAKDVALWTREAHTLKSASAAVGAEPLRAVCAEIEQAGRDGVPPPPDAEARLKGEWARVLAFFDQWKKAE